MKCIWKICLLLIVVFVNANISDAASTRPNIVVILADDFGVGDIQAHYPKNKIATPYLDRFVQQGMSFTDAHSPSAVCSPTRYGLLTGRYAWRTRLQEWVIAAYEPPLISADRPTLPGMLKKNGYSTSCIGKWHLGWNWAGPQSSRMTEAPNGQKSLTWDFTKPITGGPIERGFDYFYGVDLPNLPPFTFIENDRVTIQPSDQYEYDPNEGVAMPRGFVGAPIAPNWQFDQILPEITKRAVQQIHQLAKQKQPFFLYFSMTSPHEPVVPSKMFKGKSGIAPIADFVMETDWSAGQVIQAIDEAGIAEDTIVIFTADNGHSHYTGWQDLVDAGHMPSGEFRGHKGDIWEGGHRVPLVVRWPEKVVAGSTSDQMVSLTDLYATCADLIGAELSKTGAEDSLSFLHSLLGKSSNKSRNQLVSHSNHGEFAYRAGPWKLVFRNDQARLDKSRGKPTIAELYNLESDISEKVNLAQQNPEIVQRITHLFKQTIANGSSREGLKASNDAEIIFERTQSQRWAEKLKQ